MQMTARRVYRFDDFELEPSRRTFHRGGERIALAPKTYEVLLCLVSRPGRVVLKDEILKEVWPDSFVEEGNLAQHIFSIRKALTDRAGAVATLPGRGYQFTVPVEEVSEPELMPTAAGMPGFPAGLEGIVSFAGATAQYGRTKTRIVMEELVHAPAEPVAQPRSQSRVSTRWMLWGAFAALLSLATGLVWWRWTQRSLLRDRHEVVLGSFENETGDPSFDHALSTLLSIDLSQSPNLVVAANSETQQVLKLMNRPAGTELTPTVAGEVCQRLNDQVMLQSSIAGFGGKYLVTLAATDCLSGKSLAQAKAVADGRDDVIPAVDAVAAEMRRKLGETLKGRTASGEPLPLAHTFSLEALKVYSQAESLSANVQVPEAILMFKQAIELDPKFAAAWLGLAKSYGRMGEDNQSREAATRAYELRDQSDDLLRLMIVDYYNLSVAGDYEARTRNLRTWTRMYPLQPQPWLDLANLEDNFEDTEAAVVAGRRALELVPNNPIAYSILAEALLVSGRLDEAKNLCLEAIRRKVDNQDLHRQMMDIAYLRHDAEGVRAQVEWAKGTEMEGRMDTWILLSEGKAHAGVAQWLRRIERQRQKGFQQGADMSASILLRREADYNMDQELREQLPTVPPSQHPNNVIIANAELGRVAVAEQQLKAMAATMPPNGSDAIYNYPQARAAVALAKHKPEEAIADLDVTRPLEMRSLEPILMRGRAYLEARDPAQAEREFRIVIDHPTLALEAPFHPLAHLGLAEALEMQGNHAAARQEYETLFDLWKDADADLPPLVRARSEYAAIH